MAVHGLTASQKRAHVLAYVQRPYGTRGAYLVEHQISGYQLRRWRAQMYTGTLEVGLVPREGRMFVAEANAEIRRLLAENQALREQLGEQAQAAEQAIAVKQAELDASVATVDALGKAIALLHAGNESAANTTGS